MPPDGAKARRRYVPARATTKEEVVSAALRIIDSEGLEALSMRRLAEELGVAHMTIYNYVDGKDGLLDEVALLVLGNLEHDVDPDLPWQRQLAVLITDLRVALRSHPGITELILSRPPPIPGFDPSREAILAILRGAGFAIPDAVDALTALACYAVGYAHVEQVRHPDQTAEEAERLRGLPTDTFPHLVEASAVYTGHASDRAFQAGLDSLIQGLAARAGIDRPQRERKDPNV